MGPCGVHIELYVVPHAGDVALSWRAGCLGVGGTGPTEEGRGAPVGRDRWDSFCDTQACPRPSRPAGCGHMKGRVVWAEGTSGSEAPHPRGHIGSQASLRGVAFALTSSPALRTLRGPFGESRSFLLTPTCELRGGDPVFREPAPRPGLDLDLWAGDPELGRPDLGAGFGIAFFGEIECVV